MTLKKKIWRKSDSGLIIPDGYYQDSSSRAKSTFQQVAEKAAAIRAWVTELCGSFPVTTDFGRLLGEVELICKEWEAEPAKKYPTERIFKILQFSRIAGPVLALKTCTNASRYITELLDGSVDLLGSVNSKAKNTFWELELWAMFREKHLDAVLCDPPDIIVNIDGMKVGVACKKIYSERNVSKVLSQAVSQVEGSFDFGIVALNLDDLTPRNAILKKPSPTHAKQTLDDFNGSFLQTNERQFRRYLSPPGRIIAAAISTTVIADFHGYSPQFNNYHQATFWTFPGLPEDKTIYLERISSRLLS